MYTLCCKLHFTEDLFTFILSCFLYDKNKKTYYYCLESINCFKFYYSYKTGKYKNIKLMNLNNK